MIAHKIAVTMDWYKRIFFNVFPVDKFSEWRNAMDPTRIQRDRHFVRDELLLVAADVGMLCSIVRECIPPCATVTALSLLPPPDPDLRYKQRCNVHLSNILFNLSSISVKLGVQLESCILQKVSINAQKYPVEACKVSVIIRPIHCVVIIYICLMPRLISLIPGKPCKIHNLQLNHWMFQT